MKTFSHCFLEMWKVAIQLFILMWNIRISLTSFALKTLFEAFCSSLTLLVSFGSDTIFPSSLLGVCLVHVFGHLRLACSADLLQQQEKTKVTSAVARTLKFYT